MNAKVLVASAVLWIGSPLFGHRLNEYLQATILSVEKDHVEASMRLIPGVAVSSMVLASIDSNHDGVISSTERLASLLCWSLRYVLDKRDSCWMHLCQR